FYNNGKEDIYLSSADLMQRNLDRRVEIAFPVTDPDLKSELMKTLVKASLKDNIKARKLLPDMNYEFVVPVNGEKRTDSQEWLMNYTVKSASHYKKMKTK
ncbi:MAG: RNA degradosome polyphosphate kinase, partial [Ignavibacteriaceae bacterium]